MKKNSVNTVLMAAMLVFWWTAMVAADGNESMNGAVDTGGKDGGYGVDWPVPRFKDNKNGTLTDRLTKYVWLKNANCFKGKTFDEAIAVSRRLAHGTCGLRDGSVAGDWHSPTINELLTLVDYSQFAPTLPRPYFFTNILTRKLKWSSTPYRNPNTPKGWHLNLRHGNTVLYAKTARLGVMPVRRLKDSDPDANVTP